MSDAIIIALISMASSAVGGFVVWLRTRNKDRFEEMKLMQEVYNGMVRDVMKGTDYKVEQLTTEVHMLRQTLEKVYTNCEVPTCKNFILKQNHLNE